MKHRCKVCKEKVEDMRPVCGSCSPLMRKYEASRRAHECKRWGEFIPVETRRDRRAARKGAAR